MTSTSNIFQNQDVAIMKVKSALNTFKENKNDIAFLWNPMPILPEIEEAFDSNFLKGYSEIINEFKEDRWGIFVDDMSIENAIEIADAFYGDADAVTLRIRDLKKPVMLQNYNII